MHNYHQTNGRFPYGGSNLGGSRQGYNPWAMRHWDHHGSWMLHISAVHGDAGDFYERVRLRPQYVA